MSNDIRIDARDAVQVLLKQYRHGAYRVIKDPEGAISFWKIESKPNDPFSISFVEKGRVYNRIEDVPLNVLKSFVEYVHKKFRGR